MFFDLLMMRKYMEEKEIIQLKKFCLDQACRVYQHQKTFDDSMAVTPLELAQWFFDWVSGKSNRNYGEYCRHGSYLEKIVTFDPNNPDVEGRQE